MTSSSKRRASSSKQSSAGKAHVISVGRKDALPRKGSVPAGRRKPAVPSPDDAPKDALAVAMAPSNKRAHKLQHTEASTSRTKAARTAGRASGKLNKLPATELMRTAAAVTPAAAASEGEALAIVETELEVEASAILEETTIVEVPIAPPPHPGRRALVTVVSRLLSMLCRWTGVR